MSAPDIDRSIGRADAEEASDGLPQLSLESALRAVLREEVERQHSQAANELEAAPKRRTKLEADQAKLLKAHFAGAIPLNLTKREQDRISRELVQVKQRIEQEAIRFDSEREALDEALALASRLGPAYCQADDKMRRMINQALFTAIYIDENGPSHHQLEAPFELLLSGPIGEVALTTVQAADDSGRAWAEFIQAHSDVPSIDELRATNWRIDAAHAANEEATRDTPNLVGAGV